MAATVKTILCVKYSVLNLKHRKTSYGVFGNHLTVLSFSIFASRTSQHSTNVV